jgi:hypothetical protein
VVTRPGGNVLTGAFDEHVYAREFGAQACCLLAVVAA